jgi:LuxR family maltose regulon positive regulatory protein
LELLPPEYQYDRCVAAFHGGGFFILTGELDQAQEYLKDALNWSTQLNNPLAKLLTLSNLGHLECVRGRLKLAEQYFLEAYQLAHEIKVRQGSTFSMAVIGLANLHYEWNDLQRAETLIAEGIKIVESGKFLDRLLLGYSSKIRIHNVQGEYDQALNAIQRINQLAILYNAPQKITERIEALSAIISLAEGSFPKAASWAARFSTNFRDEPSYENEFEIMILCKVLIAQEMYPAALDWLKKLLKLALEQGRFDSIIRIEVLLAKVYYLQDEVEKALEQIQQALILAEAGNYQRVFLDEGFTIKMLLTQLFQSRNRDQHIKISSDYIGNLLGAFTAESLPIESDGQHPLMQLTNRELDVLKFLATGLSYAALAEKLNITENTVRTHVKNIYGKLGVNNRTQALLEAKKLDLL